MSTTFEEAKRCPKCNIPGEDTGKQPTKRRGVYVHIIACRTQVCPWYSTTWFVQVNEDGTVPEPYSQVGPKQYPKASPELETRINENIQAQLEAEMKPGSEIRNPRA